ncbi:tetratricopeptide repeat protein [Desertibaculum subflavum]|uniref:tetratricopeptide repeat protein n=1 Tax=Desertibaculum subflavum TaxID=2268458 RepID=UPI0013C488F5
MTRIFRRTGVGGTALALLLTACQSMHSGNGGRDGMPVTMVSPAGSYLAGLVARDDRDLGAAATFFQIALEADPDNLNLARSTMIAAVSAGRMEDAVRLADRIVKADTRDPIGNLLLGVRALHADRPAEASGRFSVASRTRIYALLMPIASAWALYGDGRFDEAEGELRNLRENGPFAPFAHYHLALLNDAAGRREAAESAYSDALRQAGPAAMRLVEAYGSFLERTGRIGDAEKLYRDVIGRQGDAPPIEAALARLLAGQPSKPLVTTAIGGVAEAFYGAASALVRDEDGDAGLLFDRFALYADPQFDVARLLLGERLERLKRYEDAVEVYRGIGDRSIFASSAGLRHAWALHQLKRDDEAVTILRKTAALDGSDPEAFMTLGDILRSGDRYAEAAEEYGRAIERVGQPEERHWTLFYARGIALERAKQWPQAEADFLKALELRPDQPLVLNYLGYSWIEQGLHLQRARQMVERAVSLRPNDGYIVDSLGWALYRLGHYAEAVTHLERAVELKPVDPTINDHLGDAYWKVGRHNEARFQWQRALAMKPDADQVARIKAKLESGLVENAADRPLVPVKNGG